MEPYTSYTDNDMWSPHQLPLNISIKCPVKYLCSFKFLSTHCCSVSSLNGQTMWEHGRDIQVVFYICVNCFIPPTLYTVEQFLDSNFTLHILHHFHLQTFNLPLPLTNILTTGMEFVLNIQNLSVHWLLIQGFYAENVRVCWYFFVYFPFVSFMIDLQLR